jgi:membrane protease subunit (stomatin/prohibitin family)
MAFFDKLGDIARNIGDKATDAIETTKLNNKISAEKTAIAEFMRQIGEYYYGKHQAGESDDPGAAELYAAIDGHNRTIADTQAEIARIQAENEAQSAQAQTAAVPTAAPAPASDSIACPSCGKINAPGTKFCCECGGKLEIPAPAVPETRPCPGCGAQIPADNKFCGECGYKFE